MRKLSGGREKRVEPCSGVALQVRGPKILPGHLPSLRVHCALSNLVAEFYAPHVEEALQSS